MKSLRQQKANKLLAVIEKYGAINLYDALDVVELGMQDWYGRGFRGWFISIFQDELHCIQYDKNTKILTWRKTEETLLLPEKNAGYYNIISKPKTR